MTATQPEICPATGSGHVWRPAAAVFEGDPPCWYEPCCRCGQRRPLPDGWHENPHVQAALDDLADAVWERDDVRAQPRHRTTLPCCDGCSCHFGPARDGQPCDRCVDMLDSRVVDAEKRLADTIHTLGSAA